MKKTTARILLKWSYVVSGLLLVLSLLDVFVWQGRYTEVSYAATALLVLLIVLILLMPHREAYRTVAVPEKTIPRTILRWSAKP